MTVIGEDRNTKKMMLGGGMGTLIPLGPRSKQSSKTDSAEKTSTPSLNEQMAAYSNQLAQEAREQFGASPQEDTDESTSPTTQPKED